MDVERLKARAAEISEREEARLLGDAGRAQCRAVPGEALGGRIDLGPVTQKCDPPVTPGDQVGHGPLGAAAVVAEDAVGVDRAGRPVDEHQPQAVGDVAQQMGMVGGRGDDDQAVHPP